MSETKNEAAGLPTNDFGQSATPITTDIIADFDAAVKRNDLREAMDLLRISTRDAALILRPSFPKLDKTVVSKCSRPALYGCVLHPDGFRILREHLPEAAAKPEQDTAAKPRKKHRSGRHRYTARVAGRLPDDKFLKLQRYIEAEGYETVQDWVTAQVDAFIEKMEAKYG